MYKFKLKNSLHKLLYIVQNVNSDQFLELKFIDYVFSLIQSSGQFDHFMHTCIFNQFNE